MLWAFEPINKLINLFEKQKKVLHQFHCGKNFKILNESFGINFLTKFLCKY